MRFPRILKLFLNISICLMFGSLAFAQDGKVLYKKLTCFVCHGEEGKGMFTKDGKPLVGFEAYPKLAGQNSAYLYNQIKDIFSGKRNNGMSSAMLGIKQMIDSSAKDEDLKAIADYLSQVK